MKLLNKVKNETAREFVLALWLFALLYCVLAFGDFGTGFQYAGF